MASEWALAKRIDYGKSECSWPMIDSKQLDRMDVLLKTLRPSDNAWSNFDHGWRVFADLRVIVELVDPDRGAMDDSRPADVELIELLWNNGRALVALAKIISDMPIDDAIALLQTTKEQLNEI